jgi:hypothetical protein
MQFPVSASALRDAIQRGWDLKTAHSWFATTVDRLLEDLPKMTPPATCTPEGIRHLIRCWAKVKEQYWYASSESNVGEGLNDAIRALCTESAEVLPSDQKAQKALWRQQEELVFMVLNELTESQRNPQKISEPARRAFDWQTEILTGRATAEDLEENLRVLWGEVLKAVVSELRKFRIPA